MPGEVLVKFTPALAVAAGAEGTHATDSAAVNQLLADLGVTAVQPVFADAPVNSTGLERIYKLFLAADGDVLGAVAALAGTAGVEYAEPNYIYTVQAQRERAESVPSGGMEQTPPTDGSEEEAIRAAVRAALGSRAAAVTGSAAEQSPGLVPTAVQFSETWAYAQIAAVTPDAAPAMVSLALLHRTQAGEAWQVALPPSVQWQEWLAELPGTLIDTPTRNYLLGTLVPSAPVANFSGYRLPWNSGQSGEIGCVVSNCTLDDGTAYHNYPAADFRLSEASWIRAAKGGTVVYRKDASSGTCDNINCWNQANLVVLQHGSGEYSWYMHLALGTIPAAVQEGTEVEQGTILGRQGCTGYCTGDHVHLMVSTVFSVTSNQDDPVRRMPDWPTGQLAAYDLGEISWSNLVQSADGTVIVSANPTSDALFGQLWGLQNTGQGSGVNDADIDAPGAWAITRGSDSVLIAVIDTGVDYRHDDLNDGRVRTDIDRDFVNGDDDALDDEGHGTHVAGTIAAESDNRVGVTGVMWKAKILPLKAMDKNGSGTVENIANAIRYAADKGARIINMSLGGSSCSQTMADAVNYAYFDKNVVIVASAGNNGGSIGYPAKYAPVIAVGATDRTDKRTFFSSHGADLDLMAPGQTVFSTVPNNGYDALSGTSMAAPHVAGVAGLLLSQRPTLTTTQVNEILTLSADDLGQNGFDTYYGYGRVNARKALLADTPGSVTPPERVECPSESCAAVVALSTEPDGSNILTNLRAVRDNVFTQDPGRRWSQIYYQYQWDVAWIVVSDSQVRTEVTAGFRAFDPVFQALLSDDPNQVVTLTPELIEAARKALTSVAAQGGADMSSTIYQEWDRVNPDRFVGWDVRDVWQQLQQENLTPRLYLPQVVQ
jgi:subtilisin family serine protease